VSFHVPEDYRITAGGMASDASYGNNGAFAVPGPRGFKLNVIAGDGLGWEHVSVSVKDAARCPTWDEMCAIKELFWDGEDCVVQYHPPKSDYVNNHPYVLHLWRPVGVEMPRPPHELVGVRKNSGVAVKALALAILSGGMR
jgi:hypothetical protein